MANYTETQVTGLEVQRAYSVSIENPVDRTPCITFLEEQAINIDNTWFTKHLGQLTEYFSDPTVVFNILNPEDGSIIRQATYQEVYVMLYSLYFHLANLRDAAETPAP